MPDAALKSSVCGCGFTVYNIQVLSWFSLNDTCSFEMNVPEAHDKGGAIWVRDKRWGWVQGRPADQQDWPRAHGCACGRPRRCSREGGPTGGPGGTGGARLRNRRPAYPKRPPPEAPRRTAATPARTCRCCWPATCSAVRPSLRGARCAHYAHYATAWTRSYTAC